MILCFLLGRRRGSFWTVGQHAIASQDVVCKDNVDAFILEGDDAAFICKHYGRLLRTPRVRGILRFSPDSKSNNLVVVPMIAILVFMLDAFLGLKTEQETCISPVQQFGTAGQYLDFHNIASVRMPSVVLPALLQYDILFVNQWIPSSDLELLRTIVCGRNCKFAKKRLTTTLSLMQVRVDVVQVVGCCKNSSRLEIQEG